MASDGFLPESVHSLQDDDADADENLNSESLQDDSNNQVEEVSELSTAQTSTYRLRGHAKIIRTCRFNIHTHREDHFREILMLYTHWRNEEELINLRGAIQSNTK